MSLVNKLSLSVLGLAVMFMAAALAVPHDAFAASEISKHVGDEAKAWGTALIGGCAALAGVPSLMKREFQGAGAVAGIAVLIGGFVFADGTVKTVIQTLWKTVAG